MDGGGELFQNPDVKPLFKKYGYECVFISTDSYFQNGLVERAHRNVCIGIKSLLIGAELDVKFRPHISMYVLQIRNAMPGCRQDASPLFLYTRKKDICNPRVFGYRV